MKKYLGLLTASILSLTILSACNMDTMSAGEYNDTIVNILDYADEDYENYWTYASETSNQYLDKIQTKLDTAIKTQKSYKERIIEVGSYKGDSAFLDAATAYMNINIELLENYSQQIVDLWTEAYKIPEADRNETIEAEYEEKQEVIFDEMDAIITQQAEDMQVAQEFFAQEYSFELEETPEDTIITD